MYLFSPLGREDIYRFHIEIQLIARINEQMLLRIVSKKSDVTEHKHLQNFRCVFRRLCVPVWGIPPRRAG